VHDGIELERQGVITGVVVTEPFVGAARAMAALDGAPDYPFATVAHPTADLDGDALQRIAAHAAAQLDALLSSPPGSASARATRS
jgi:hypothetical protein